MKLEFRCANCGNPIRNPEDECNICGYTRSTEGKTVSKPGQKHNNIPADSLPKSPPRKNFSWIFIILVILPVVARNFPHIVDNFNSRLKNVKYLIGLDDQDYTRVSVLVASRDIDADQLITNDDVKIVMIDLSNAPRNAVAPLNVDRLIGTRTTSKILENQIFVIDPCD